MEKTACRFQCGSKCAMFVMDFNMFESLRGGHEGVAGIGRYGVTYCGGSWRGRVAVLLEEGASLPVSGTILGRTAPGTTRISSRMRAQSVSQVAVRYIYIYITNIHIKYAGWCIARLAGQGASKAHVGALVYSRD